DQFWMDASLQEQCRCAVSQVVWAHPRQSSLREPSVECVVDASRLERAAIGTGEHKVADMPCRARPNPVLQLLATMGSEGFGGERRKVNRSPGALICGLVLDDKPCLCLPLQYTLDDQPPPG